MQKKMGKKKQTKVKRRSVQDEWQVSVVNSDDEGNKNAMYSLHEEQDQGDSKEESLTPVEKSAESSVSWSRNLKNKKKLKNGVLVQRSEASQNISEFNLTEVGKEKVKLNELIKTSQKLSGQTSVKKQLEKAKKLKSLSTPLSKPQLEKIKRTVAYDKICDDVSKWEPIVRSNRSADQTIYPLKAPEFRLETFEKVSEKFVTKHPVEVAVSELLKKSENTMEKDKPLTVAEEKALQAMSLEEAKLRHNELMKHRALLSYQEAKARRQNKIKSKRYHRILKKEKMKKVMKEFEELQKVDAAAAIEKIMEADKLRIMERMTLKHRNTGKWAKVQKLRAKYNPEARSVLKEDVNIGRQLREKVPEIEKTINQLKASLEAQDVDDTDDVSVYNPGLIEDADVGLTNIFESDTLLPVTNSEAESSSANDKGLQSPVSHDPAEKPSNSVKKTQAKKSSATTPTVAAEFVNMDFISEAKTLDSYNPSNITIGDHLDEVEGVDDMDDEDADEAIQNVSEAFANEDVIAEFREDKKAADEANRPKGINLFLPGWGSWGGSSIKVSKRKRSRFLIKPLEEPATKKNTLGNVIINEDKDKKASVHQVNHLPFPFSNIHQFESYIRQPIGHTWNSQSSFQNLVAPKTITKMGKIIEPIDAEDVVLDKRTKQKSSQKIKKKKLIEQRAF